MQSDTGLTALHDDFVATSTQSMPLAGIIFWTVIAIASRLLSPAQVAYLVGRNRRPGLVSSSSHSAPL